MADLIHPVILCGGSGTRLWPLSTPEHPKQFLALTSDKPMIVETADRFGASHVDGLSFAETLVVGSQKHKTLLQKTLPRAKLILEPFGRNSAPAVAAACLAVQPEDLLLILPADHNIRNVEAFQAAIAIAAKAANDGAIVTFGIEPSHPATGYGYIKAKPQPGAKVLDVDRFVEKPPEEKAMAYLAEGNYFWNAGIFLFRADTMLAALKEHAGDILPPVQLALGTPSEAANLLQPEAFAQAPDISIDYAVMERADNVQVVPVEMGWSDVGGYEALVEMFADAEGCNVTTGPVAEYETKNLYVSSDGPVIAVGGVSDLNVIATEGTVMITPLGHAPSIKALGKKVQAERDRLGVPQAICDEARDWLWRSFDVWSEKAWDDVQGGFVEQLSLDGVPDTSANRRVRVQARQVYSFARALDLGWSNHAAAEDMVAKGLDYIDTKLRHAEGGWLHVVDGAGAVVDDRRDLYDHAFIILAGAGAYKATGSALALKIAHDAVDFINARLKDNQNSGWFEGVPDVEPRRANPHMHIVEAMLALHGATGEARALEMASEVVDLFETRFFNPATNVMAEFFERDWSALGKSDDTVWEPGHHYEWATLLTYFERLTGRDTVSWRRRLIRRAEESGLDAASGFAVNALKTDGSLTNAQRRLWPQLERFRSHLLHPGVATRGSHETRFRAIMETYLDWGPDGCWLDETDQAGEPCAKAIPASILYHVVTAFSPLIEA